MAWSTKPYQYDSNLCNKGAIAAILCPNVIDSGNADKERQKIQPKRQLLSGSVDQVGKDLQEIQQIGVVRFILNYNRSVIILTRG